MTATTSKYAHQSEATTTTPRTAAEMMPAESEKPAAPTPSAMIDSPKRDDDDEPVPLREVCRRDVPAPPAADQIISVQDGEPDDPECGLRAAVDEPGHQDDRGADRGRRREPNERATEVAVSPAGDRVEHEIEQAHEQVGDPEQHRVGSERARDGEGEDEHRSHRTEHASADHALLGLERVREPGIARPRPPDRGEHEQAATDPPLGEVVRHELGHLRDREHHDEIEEELQGGDSLVPLGRLSVHPYELVERGTSLIVTSWA